MTGSNGTDDRHGDPPPTTGAVIMAAGAGRRMGGMPKSLLRRDGEPLLLRQVRLSAEAGVEIVVVVLGHYAGRLAQVLDLAQASSKPPLDRHRLHSVANPTPDAGTGSSLRCGLAALPASLSTWLVLLGDQPLLEFGDVRGILHAWRARAAGIELVLPQHQHQLGHPIAFGSTVRDAVMHAPGSRGVREWRRAYPERVAIVPARHARYTFDVDTPADLDRLRAEHGISLEWPPARPG